MSETATTPGGVTTVTLEDGSMLAYGPSVMDGDGNVTEPNGFDWTRYDADGETEAQDWAQTEGEMAAVVAAFER